MFGAGIKMDEFNAWTGVNDAVRSSLIRSTLSMWEDGEFGEIGRLLKGLSAEQAKRFWNHFSNGIAIGIIDCAINERATCCCGSKGRDATGRINPGPTF